MFIASELDIGLSDRLSQSQYSKGRHILLDCLLADAEALGVRTIAPATTTTWYLCLHDEPAKTSLSRNFDACISPIRFRVSQIPHHCQKSVKAWVSEPSLAARHMTNRSRGTPPQSQWSPEWRRLAIWPPNLYASTKLQEFYETGLAERCGDAIISPTRSRYLNMKLLASPRLIPIFRWQHMLVSSK